MSEATSVAHVAGQRVSVIVLVLLLWVLGAVLVVLWVLDGAFQRGRDVRRLDREQE